MEIWVKENKKGFMFGMQIMNNFSYHLRIKSILKFKMKLIYENKINIY